MGARLLNRWVLFPLRSVREIEERQNGVECFFRQPDFRDLCQQELERIGDLERIVSKVAVGRVNPREMQQLRVALDSVARLKEACAATSDDYIRQLGLRLDCCEELRSRILHDLRLDPPALVAKGGVIGSGVNEELDELRRIAYSGKDYLLKLQQRESDLTGIPSLKIGYNNVFGYYIEVRNTHKDKVPAEWIRKQTLANAERYITQELKEYEEKILGAEEKILALET
jgi:DNA mismatch repair protein MutS